MQHPLKWHTASPVWGPALADGGPPNQRFDQPLLLRFAGDDFMERLQGTLASDPNRLAEYAARQETWKTAPLQQAGWQTVAEQAAGGAPKLYQPAHNRFYLVTAQLVCRQRGLPDREIDAANQERAAFLMRRLFAKPGQALDPKQPSTYDEYGWFGGRQQGSWLKIDQPDFDAPEGEERLPMFPSSFEQEGRKRRLFAGMIPVASREIYEEGERKESIAAAGPGSDPRLARYSAEVGAPLQDLANLGTAASDAAAQDGLIFLLIALGEFLAEELPAVWTDISGGAPSSGTQAAVAARLRNPAYSIKGHTWAGLTVNANHPSRKAAFLGGARPTSLTPVGQNFTRTEIAGRAALLYQSPLAAQIPAALGDPRQHEFATLLASRIAPLASLPAAWGDAAAREELLGALLELSAFLQRELPQTWAAIAAGSPAGLTAPRLAVYNFLESRSLGAATWRAVLADAAANRGKIESQVFDRAILAVRLGISKTAIEAFGSQATAGALLSMVNAALAAQPVSPAPPPEAPSPDAHYVIRCVYDRPRCPVSPPLLSRPTRPFRLASFFDPDAPVRPLKVRMPVDTSFEGLRKFPKGVQFLLSDQLRKQMARAEEVGMQGLLDGKEGSAGLNLGVICSFSIPIISICALILLMIIVQLLNIVFWWLPLFRICLPLPLKAK